jgi:PAS domain S-box-containing protein
MAEPSNPSPQKSGPDTDSQCTAEDDRGFGQRDLTKPCTAGGQDAEPGKEPASRGSVSQLDWLPDDAEVAFSIRDPKTGWIPTPELNTLFGRQRNAPLLRGEEFAAFIHPDDLPYLRQAWNVAMENRSPRFRQEYRVVWQDGSVHWMVSRVRLFPETDTAICITYDISEGKKREETLLTTGEELQNLIEWSDDGIIITDEQGQIIKWNRGAETIIGVPAKDVVGVPAWEVQSRSVTEEWAGPDPRTHYKMLWDHLLHDETDQHFGNLFDGQIRTPTGDIRYIQQRVFRIPTRHGFRIGVIFRDITDRKRIEDAIQESEEKYRAIVEMSPDAILIIQDKKIIYANTAAAFLLGESHPDDLIGKHYQYLLHPDSKLVVDQRLNEALQGVESPFTEVQLYRVDGTVKTFEEKGKRLAIRGRPAIQVILRDATERKKAELQVKKYTEDLKRSYEDLEILASITAHDLQEPIRGIVTYSQLLLARNQAGEDPAIRKYLKIIENSGLWMNTLISDLREYSRVKTREKAIEQSDLEVILSEVLENLRLMIQDSRVSITHDKLPVVRADAMQITQVFQNLIENAIKFRKKDEMPDIHISAVLEEGMWQFAVRDNGIGIPTEYYQKIFLLFERLHPKDAYSGTGLGLALCKKIIDRHGGQIWVESEVGKGSTFYFTIPAEAQTME